MMADRVQKIYDNSGNAVYSERAAHGWNIYLKLASEHHRRLLGYVANGTFHIERKRAKHLYNKLRAYGFNYEVLKRMEKVERVVVRDEYEYFEISKADLLEKGKFLNHKKSGFELQIFVDLKTLKGETTNRESNEVQGNLF